MRPVLPVVRDDSPRAGSDEPVPEPPEGWAPGPLVDARGRRITYLRASITDRCSMSCVYCMPTGGEGVHARRPELLSFEEITRLVSLFARHGIRRVRLTGGEPLVRRDAVELVRRIAEAGVGEIAMTTNGARLGTLARPLREAGLGSVNVSVDSLDGARFAEITRGGLLYEVLAGIDAALEVGLEVKINCVALGGVNDGELGAIVDWAWSLGIVPRFIELMPIGEAAGLPPERFVPAARIVEALGDRVEAGPAETVADRGPARYLGGPGGRVGIITAVSDEFCAGCNRIRLTSHGSLRACLASRRAVSLRDRLRAGATDRELVWAALVSLGGKADGHAFADAGDREHARVGMSLVGG